MQRYPPSTRFVGDFDHTVPVQFVGLTPTYLYTGTNAGEEFLLNWNAILRNESFESLVLFNTGPLTTERKLNTRTPGRRDYCLRCVYLKASFRCRRIKLVTADRNVVPNLGKMLR